MTIRTGQTLIRLIVGFALPVAMIVMALLPFILYQDRLPDPMASHWDFNGPDDSMPIKIIVLIILAVVSVPAGALLYCGLRWSKAGSRLKVIIPFWAFAGSLVVIVNWCAVQANLDVADWHHARLFALADFGTRFSLAILVGVITYLLMRFVEIPAQPERPVPSAHLKPGERGVWVGSARALWAQIIVVGFGFAGVIMLLQGMHLGYFFLLIMLPAVMFLRIQVLVDNKGVRITWGPFNSTFKFIPLTDIKQARCIHVVPLEHGGWGYRGSLKVFGRAAFVQRGGEGIEIRFKNDKILTVTVDDAETGAGLINDLVGQVA